MIGSIMRWIDRDQAKDMLGPSNAMIRHTITFIGTVQGVGFRYTTRNVASGFAVTGWVRNEPDGSVLCVVEGDEPELQRFLAAVQQAMQGHIRDTHLVASPATGEFMGSGFHIRK
jgi:acylphosphatase